MFTSFNFNMNLINEIFCRLSTWKEFKFFCGLRRLCKALHWCSVKGGNIYIFSINLLNMFQRQYARICHVYAALLDNDKKKIKNAKACCVINHTNLYHFFRKNVNSRGRKLVPFLLRIRTSLDDLCKKRVGFN